MNLVALLAAWVTVFDTIAKEREMLERPEQDVYGTMEAGVAQGIPVRTARPVRPTARCLRARAASDPEPWSHRTWACKPVQAP